MNLCFYLVGCVYSFYFLLCFRLRSATQHVGFVLTKEVLFRFLVHESREWKEVYSTLYLCILFVTEWIL